MPKCPKCGSENVEKTGISHDIGRGDFEGKRTPSLKKSGYKCKDCEEHFSAPES